MTTKSDRWLIVVAGPTGSGKSDLAVALARRFGAPIISTDSRQLYKGMATGTAQPTAEQLAAAEHHFIATASITEEYTAGRYEREALELLEKLMRERPLAIAVGGSGLYIDALCQGMDSLPDANPELRGQLEERLREKGLEDLLQQLEELDPVYFEKVDKSNPRRVVRALEVCLQTGIPYSAQRSGVKAERPFGVIKIGTLLPRGELYARIDRRVDAMIEAGLIEEARALYLHRRLGALQTVGYRELFDWMDGKTTLEEAVGLIKRNSRRYAKRQMTWFGRDEQIAWFHPEDVDGVIRHIEVLMKIQD